MSVTMDLVWWIAVVEVPAIAALFAIELKTRKELSDYKVYVAENYTSREALKEMEAHLIQRLQDIRDQIKSIKP